MDKLTHLRKIAPDLNQATKISRIKKKYRNPYKNRTMELKKTINSVKHDLYLKGNMSFGFKL